MKIKKPIKYIKPKINSRKISINNFWDFGEFDKEFIPEALACWDPNDQWCSRSCFLSGTKIILADRSLKEIQNITKDDILLSYDIVSNKFMQDKVTELIVHVDDKSGYFIINEKIKVTGEHRFWINGVGWKKVKMLKIGDWLLNSRRGEIYIEKIKKVDGTFTVYNLHMDGENHNYFAEDILVHNWK